MFKKHWPLVILFFYLLFGLKAQHIHYKNFPADSLALFKDSISKIKFSGDTVLNFKEHFNYVLRFFPNMRYNKINVQLKASQKPSASRPSFAAMFQSPEKRNYNICFSTSTGSTLDSVTLRSLPLNAALGLIARGISHVEDLSTSGFFDILYWHFRQLSRKAKNKHEYVIEQKVLEVGLGHQLLSLSRERAERLKIENWKNAAAYRSYIKQYANRYMEAEKIINFIADLPVYAANHYY